MSEYCDFDKLMTCEEHIRDKLVIGLLDTELSLKLQMNNALTFENAIEKARLFELVKSQNSISVKSEIGHIDIVKSQVAPNRDSNRGRGSYHGYNHGSFRSHSNTLTQRHTNYPTCLKFNKFHEPNICPAYNKRCRNCDKIGHFQICCEARTVSAVTEDFYEACDNDNYDYQFIGSVDCEDSMEPHWSNNMDICGRSISFKLDSGADVTVMSEHTYKTLQHPPPFRRVRMKLGTLRGEIVAKGQFIARAVVNDRTFNFRVIVVSGKRDNLLSRAMGLIARLDSVELSDVFGNIGLMKVPPVQIRLQENASVLVHSDAYQYPYFQK